MNKIKRLHQNLFLFCLLVVVGPSSFAALPVAAGGEKLPSLAPMLENATPAVVNVATEGKITMRQNPLFADPFFRRFFNVPNQPVQRKVQALGSGVIVDAKRGLVLTNNHVIEHADQITVTLHDGRQLDAKIVGSDPETDVAVIKIPPKNLTAIKIANSDNLKVGDFVVAIGNPFGLGQTVTSGIVSALGRSGLGIEGYENFIQTDASINPGNSGGALVNLRGELVGINTAIFSRSGGNIGIGFAIPINMATQVMEQIVKNGSVQRGYLGVQVQDLNPDLAEAFDIKRDTGAVVNSVEPDSPAAKAGFKAGDVITSINGKPVRKAWDVRNQIGLKQPGKDVTFEVVRNGKNTQLTAKLASMKDQLPGQLSSINNRLEGVSVSNLDQDNPYYGKVDGVIVTDVTQGTRPWRAGLRKGDIITSVNRQNVSNVKDFVDTVRHVNGPLLFRIIRGNAAAFLVI